MHLLKYIHPELLSRTDQRLKRIPSPNPLPRARLQAHVSFAYALPGCELGRIIMQEQFGMGKHHQQGFLLGQRQRFPLVQLFVVAGLPEEPLKLTPQIVGLLLVGLVPVGHELPVQLPEVLLEFVQPLAMESKAWGQLLIVAIFMHPAEGQFSRQPVTLRRIVTD